MAARKKTETDQEAERDARTAEARREVEDRIKANERMHERAERAGAKMKAHEQDRSEPIIHSDRPADEGAVVAVEVARSDEPHDIGQESLGMGKLKVAAGAQQPPPRGRAAFTPATTKPDGTAFTFAAVTGIGAQGVKTNGAQQQITGTPHPGVILSDTPSIDPSNPTYSDRVLSDPDMAGSQTGGVVPSGAVNPKRAEFPKAAQFMGGELGMENERVAGDPGTDEAVMESDSRELPKAARDTGVVLVGADRPTLPEVVFSDRALGHGEEVSNVSTPESQKGEPNDDGGHLLGMGRTTFLGGPASDEAVVQSDKRATPEEMRKAADEPTLAEREGAKAQKEALKESGRGGRAKAEKKTEQKVERKGGDDGEPRLDVTEVPISPAPTGPQPNADTREGTEGEAEGGVSNPAGEKE